MNTGLQDAYNLAWKLALVVAGKADAALLDSYEDERIPVAKRLLETTDRGFKLVVSDSPLAGLHAHAGHRAHRRIRDDAETRPGGRVPRRLANRHPLPRQPAVLAHRSAAGDRAAGRRPLSVAQARHAKRKSGRGSLRDARRHALSSAPFRADESEQRHARIRRPSPGARRACRSGERGGARAGEDSAHIVLSATARRLYRALRRYAPCRRPREILARRSCTCVDARHDRSRQGEPR